MGIRFRSFFDQLLYYLISIFGTLKDTQQLTPDILEQVKRNLDLSYQRLLFYRQTNTGAFSAFGLQEEKPSTWLTAYMARAFSMAQDLIQVDNDVLGKALEYLISVQKSDGSFQDEGYVFEEFNDDGLSLCAFVTLALIQNNVSSFWKKSEILLLLYYLFLYRLSLFWLL